MISNIQITNQNLIGIKIAFFLINFLLSFTCLLINRLAFSKLKPYIEEGSRQDFLIHMSIQMLTIFIILFNMKYLLVVEYNYRFIGGISSLGIGLITFLIGYIYSNYIILLISLQLIIIGSKISELTLIGYMKHFPGQIYGYFSLGDNMAFLSLYSITIIEK